MREGLAEMRMRELLEVVVRSAPVGTRNLDNIANLSSNNGNISHLPPSTAPTHLP